MNPPVNTQLPVSDTNNSLSCYWECFPFITFLWWPKVNKKELHHVRRMETESSGRQRKGNWQSSYKQVSCWHLLSQLLLLLPQHHLSVWHRLRTITQVSSLFLKFFLKWSHGKKISSLKSLYSRQVWYHRWSICFWGRRVRLGLGDRQRDTWVLWASTNSRLCSWGDSWLLC